MSTPDENTISFPVDRLKAETLRAIAKDLQLPSGGKKEDVLRRMRTSSSSGWNLDTPTKRKADGAGIEYPSTEKKPKSQSVRAKNESTIATDATPDPVASGSVDASGTSQIESKPTEADADDSKPVMKMEGVSSEPEETELRAVQNASVDGPTKIEEADSAAAQKPTFDDYFISGSTTAFISGQDLLNLTATDSGAYQGVSMLRKATPFFPDLSAEFDDRIHLWFIPTIEGEIQDVRQFQEAHKDVLSDERQGSWYEVSISRSSSHGALNVKLTKGKRNLLGEAIPSDSVVPEEGSFWVSDPRLANQENAVVLDQIFISRR